LLPSLAEQGRRSAGPQRRVRPSCRAARGTYGLHQMLQMLRQRLRIEEETQHKLRCLCMPLCRTARARKSMSILVRTARCERLNQTCMQILVRLSQHLL